MAINQYTLRDWSSIPQGEFVRNFGYRSAFISHNHKDIELARGLVALLQSNGFKVFVDWQEDYLDDSVTSYVANRIKRKNRFVQLLFFLATSNSMSSRWCAWEIGYADTQNTNPNLYIIPTGDNYTSYGNEYLQLYKRIDLDSAGGLRSYDAGSHSGTLVSSVNW